MNTNLLLLKRQIDEVILLYFYEKEFHLKRNIYCICQFKADRIKFSSTGLFNLYIETQFLERDYIRFVPVHHKLVSSYREIQCNVE